MGCLNIDEITGGKMSAFDKQVGGNHYKNMAIQPTEFCQKNKLNFCESVVIKYVCRHQDKNGRQDLEKAIHFLEMLIEMEYPIPDEVLLHHPV